MRLTKKRADNGRYYLSGLAEVLNIYPKGYGRIQVGHAVDKLAEYEELEEQCIEENSWGLWMLLEKWREFYEDIQQLYEYRKLEEQGKLLKLPCAVGDTVHHLCTFKNGESEIIEMKVECVEPCGAIRQHKGICEVWNVYAETDYTKAYFKFFDFGKTVFLTKEAAEAALKELERGMGA